jgi:hypothetical protein
MGERALSRISIPGISYGLSDIYYKELTCFELKGYFFMSKKSEFS